MIAADRSAAACHTIVMQVVAKYRRSVKVFSVLAGIAVGIVGGLFGGGGGMIAVPALTLSRVEPKKAHATAVAVILPLTLISGAIYFAKGAAPIQVALPSCAGIIAGGVLGALLLKKINSTLLTHIFYVLMIAAGLKLAL